MAPDRQTSILEALYRTGEYYREKGDIENAETQLKQALELSPTHIPSRLLLSKLLVDGVRLDEGISELEIAFQSDADATRDPLAEALLTKAKKLESDGSNDDALAVYERVIAVAPDHSAAPVRISEIWRKRAEQAVEDDDLNLALEAYAKAGCPDQVKNVKEQIRRNVIERDADAARSHAEREEWEQARACYERLIDDDPGNEKWLRALEEVDAESSLARSYAEGVEALGSSEWEKASDALLEVLIVRPDYKDAAHCLVRAIEKTAQCEEPVAEPDPVVIRRDVATSLEPEEEVSPPSPERATRFPARPEMISVLAGATLLAVVAAFVVVNFLTIPSASSAAATRTALPSELFSLETLIVVWDRFLGFFTQERVVPRAAFAIFVLLLTSGLAGWLTCSFRLERRVADDIPGDGGLPDELTPVGIVQSSLFGREVGTSSASEPPALAERASSSVSDGTTPRNGVAPVRTEPPGCNVGEKEATNGTAAPLASLSNRELKAAALKLAEEVRSFGKQWQSMAGEAASYPPPKNEDSVQLYVDLIEKLGSFQEGFDERYRGRVSETCALIQQRVSKKTQTETELGEANEAHDVEDAAQQLERMAELL